MGNEVMRENEVKALDESSDDFITMKDNPSPLTLMFLLVFLNHIKNWQHPPC